MSRTTGLIRLGVIAALALVPTTAQSRDIFGVLSRLHDKIERDNFRIDRLVGNPLYDVLSERTVATDKMCRDYYYLVSYESYRVPEQTNKMKSSILEFVRKRNNITLTLEYAGIVCNQFRATREGRWFLAWLESPEGLASQRVRIESK
jgi:hypothetical protein